MYVPLKRLHPADPESVSSAANAAVISVPETTLVTASPAAMLVSVHVVPTSGRGSGGTSRENDSVASPFTSRRLPPASTSKPVTPPSTSRYALSSVISG